MPVGREGAAAFRRQNRMREKARRQDMLTKGGLEEDRGRASGGRERRCVARACVARRITAAEAEAFFGREGPDSLPAAIL